MLITKKGIGFLSILLVVISSLSWGGEVVDIGKAGMGARVLGMGKAFVGIADDCNSLFANPAGLAKVQKIELVSMKTSLMGDVDYLMAGGSFPMEIGTIAVGYISGGVDGIVLTTLSNGRPAAGNSISYSDKEILVGYGVEVGSLLGGILDGKLYGGTTLKLLVKEAGSEGNGSGYGLDLGLLYEPTTAFALGISQRNIGSQVNWKSGASDEVAGITVLGMKLDLGKVLLGLDAELAKATAPLLMHGGMEWKAMDYLALRAGLDQLPAPASDGSTQKATASNSLTLGVGLNLFGVQIDYAHHPYYDETENTTQFVSVGYSK